MRTRNGLYGPVEEMNLITGYFERPTRKAMALSFLKPGERDVLSHRGQSLAQWAKTGLLQRIENMERRDGRIIRILERSHIAGSWDI